MSTPTNTASNIVSLLLSPFTPLFGILFPLLPSAFQLRLKLLYSVIISVNNVIFGRLLPLQTYTPTDLSGKIAIVTGANSGIGLQLAIELAKQNATVILACRSEAKALSAQSTIHQRVPSSTDRVKTMSLDTSSLASVRAFASAWTTQADSQPTPQIDIVCHNAGIASIPQDSLLSNGLTPDGLELVYATNLLGSFLLTHLLEPHLSPTARIIFTSSTGQYEPSSQLRFKPDFAPGPVRGVVEPGFHCPISHRSIFGWRKTHDTNSGRYTNTKCMQTALARCLQRKWDREAVLLHHQQQQQQQLQQQKEEDQLNHNPSFSSPPPPPPPPQPRGRTAHTFTPNFTSTPIFSKIPNVSLRTITTIEPEYLFLILTESLLAIDVSQGAMTGSWLASTQDEEVCGFGKGGGYWDRMERRVCTADLFDWALLERLWGRWERDAGVQWGLYGSGSDPGFAK